MNVEQIIKAALDGTFYRVSVNTGAVSAESVPLDYMPRYEVAPVRDKPPGPRHNQRPRTPDEDNELMRMRGEGMTWFAIADTQGRDIKTVRNRYFALCKERGISVAGARRRPPTRLSDETKAEILRLRDMGMSYPSINATLGLSGSVARDYYAYITRRKRSPGEAA
jgi:hypothetical protein